MTNKNNKKHNKFVEEFEQLVGENEYEFMSVYTSTREKISIKHIACGHIRTTRANDIIGAARKNNLRCTGCKNKPILSTDIIIKQLKELVGEEYSLTGAYVARSKPIKIKHNTCGHEYETKYNSFFKCGHRCQKCHISQKLKKKPEEFENEINNLTGDEYKIVTPYINSLTKVGFLHNIENCGNIFYMKPNDFTINKQRCPKCGQISRTKNLRKKHEDYEKEFIEIHGDGYLFVNKYKNSLDNIILRHKKCGYVWDLPIITTLRKRYTKSELCPNCSKSLSNGERRIIKELNKNSIIYRTEYTFDDCIDSSKLRFDIAVFNEDKTLKYLIEYDGEQHFFPVDFAGRGIEWATDIFTKTQSRDQIKNKYCIDNGIPLYRIPYWKYENIEKIMENILSDNYVSNHNSILN